MELPSELAASFDCRATAAVLRSGGSVALAGHVAAVITVLSMRAAWIACCAVLVWCVVVYLAIRVKIDVEFFELLAAHPAEQLDEWMDAVGLRKKTSLRTIPERRRGALRLWRALLAAVAAQVAVLLLAVFHWLA
jgi:hypothetical protein